MMSLPVASPTPSPVARCPPHFGGGTSQTQTQPQTQTQTQTQTQQR